MPPKKKKGKGGKKKKKSSEETKEEPSEYDSMDLEMLKEVTQMLRQQLQKSQLDRNYVQLERDTIQTFYDITRREVHDLELAVDAKDRQMELMEDNHRVEVRVYIQKVKHLEYEHKNNLKRVAHEGESALGEERGMHGGRETDLKANKKSLKLELMERQLRYEYEIEQMKMAHEKNLVKLREEFQKTIDGLRDNCERRLVDLRSDLELRRKVEIHEIEERKNRHINDLMKNHYQAFGQIKNYYNDITHDNLKLIRQLKDEVSEMRQKATDNQKLMYDVSQENKRLSEPLAVALKEVDRLRHALKGSEKDKMSLRNAKARLLLLEEQLRSLRASHANMEQEHAEVEAERNELYDTFESTVRSVQRRSDFRNLILERRADQLGGDLDTKTQQFQQIVQAANLDPNELSRVTETLDSMLTSRRSIITDLTYEVTRASKAYNDTLRAMESKLVGAGVPEDEFQAMGFAPLPTSSSTGPAGLVVR